jgi:hypothetical protein
MNGVLVGFVLVSVLLPIVVGEARDVAPWIAERLVLWGARRLRSKDMVDRYSEEWLADLEQVPGKVVQLFFACGVFFMAVPRLRWQFRRSEARRLGILTLAKEWYSDEVNAVVRLDVPEPEALETRTIVVTADKLDQIVSTTTIPPHPANQTSQRHIEVQSLFGVSPAVLERTSASCFRFVMKLPRVLRRGDRHTYGTVTRIPNGQWMQPHYCFVPRHRQERLTVRVRFHPDRQPLHVWKLTAWEGDVTDDHVHAWEPLILDASGEVYADFHDLLPGCRYGVRWQLDG